MKAVILAAGKGTRMGELTRSCPKPLLTIKNKTLLEYKMDILPADCSEIILVIGHLGEKIREYFGNEYKGKKVTYVVTEPQGTAHALWQAKDHLTEPFLVMCGDDLYAKDDIAKCVEHPFASLVFVTSESQSGGKVIVKDGFIHAIEEGKHETGSVVATGLYALTPEIFEAEMVKIPGREEYGLPQTIMSAQKGTLRAIYTTKWHQVTSPEDLEVEEEKLQIFM